MYRVIAAGLFVSALTGSAVAQQQATEAPVDLQSICQAAIEQSCACYEPTRTFEPTGASLSAVSGVVQVLRPAGVQPGAKDSALVIGDRVVTGEDTAAAQSAAAVSFPNGCQVSIQDQSLIAITRIEECACAIPAEGDGEVGALIEDPDWVVPVIAGGVIGGIAVTTGIGGAGGGGGSDAPCIPDSPPGTTCTP